MLILKGLKFIIKSILIAIVSVVIFTGLGVLILTNVDFSGFEEKKDIESFNEELNINLPTAGYYVTEYEPLYFTDGEYYLVYQMEKDVNDEDFVLLGFSSDSKFDEYIFSKVLSIHKSENISYSHMFNPNKDYLVNNYKIGTKDYYFIFDNETKYMFVLCVWM